MMNTRPMTFDWFVINPRTCSCVYWTYRHLSMSYCDVIMGEIASQITSLTIVYSTVYSDADQRKHQSSASLAFVRGIHRWPMNSPHKWPVTQKNASIWWRHHGYLYWNRQSYRRCHHWPHQKFRVWIDKPSSVHLCNTHQRMRHRWNALSKRRQNKFTHIYITTYSILILSKLAIVLYKITCGMGNYDSWIKFVV